MVVTAALLLTWLAPSLRAEAGCPGDCNGDRVVSIDEIILGVGIALGSVEIAACDVFDSNGDGVVTIDELLPAVGAALNGCTIDQLALVIATDFETGSFATISLDEPRIVMPTSRDRRVHGDAVGRSFGGLVYVVNRFLGDNVQVLDPAQGFATVRQCLVGERSNPHDIVFAGPRKAYVTAYDQRSLLIIDPEAPSCSGFVTGSIDLAELADEDGIPEMDQMALVGERLYVSLQRLDRRNFFLPAALGVLAIIDVASDTLIGAITLSGSNPFAQSKGLSVFRGRIVVSQVGVFGALDGGIERVDLESGRAEGFFITEAELGGDITDFVLVSERLCFAVVADANFQNQLVAFDPLAGTTTGVLPTGGGFITDIELNDRGEIFVADRTARNPGIRIFRAADGVELTERPIDLGLPPFDILFLPGPR
jgi:DNA-binding beta-propeller fold protein YncE